MNDKKLNPSLLEEDKNSLPKRGGKYVSQKAKKEEEHAQEVARLKQNLEHRTQGRTGGNSWRDDCEDNCDW